MRAFAVRVMVLIFILLAMAVGGTFLQMMTRLILVRTWLAFPMGQTGVNIELNPRDAPARLAPEMHVKISKIQLGKLPFECRGADSEVCQRSNHHVAAYA